MIKIAIPTDFSENAMNAIQYAVELFKYEHCEFYILHAYADVVYDQNIGDEKGTFNKIKSSVQEQADTTLKAILDQIIKISPNPRHQYSTQSMYESLIDAVNDFTNRENIDIVVMGTRGETDDSKLTFGSNTLQVIKYINCPVLAIPSGYKYHQPKHIVFPTDYLLPYKRREIRLLCNMSKSYRATISFLYHSDFEKLSLRQEDNKAFLTESLVSCTLQFHQIKANSLKTAINQFISNNETDMLVMVNSRHSFLENILYHSTIEKIGLHIKIPFLVMQNIERY